MKCICGYEREDIWDGENHTVIGTQEFLHLNLNSTVESMGSEGWKYLKKEEIYGCPKCGTLKIINF